MSVYLNSIQLESFQFNADLSPFPFPLQSPLPLQCFFSPGLSPLLSFLSLSLSQPLPFSSLTANQFTPFPLFLPTHCHQIFSLPAIIWPHVQTIIHAPAKYLFLHPAPLTCHFCLFFFAFYSRFQRCDDIASYVTLFTPSLERTLPSNTHSHTPNKRGCIQLIINAKRAMGLQCAEGYIIVQRSGAVMRFDQDARYSTIYTGAGHIIRISSKSWFISLIPFKKWNLYSVYIHSTQTDIFQVFISFNFDDYNWQLMKTPNSVSQKIRILWKGSILKTPDATL